MLSFHYNLINLYTCNFIHTLFPPGGDTCINKHHITDIMTSTLCSSSFQSLKSMTCIYTMHVCLLVFHFIYIQSSGWVCYIEYGVLFQLSLHLITHTITSNMLGINLTVFVRSEYNT